MLKFVAGKMTEDTVVPIMYPALSQIAVERQTEGSPEACPWSYSTASNTASAEVKELAVTLANSFYDRKHNAHNSSILKIFKDVLQTDKPVFDQNDYHLQDKWSMTPRTSDQTSMILNHSRSIEAILD